MKPLAKRLTRMAPSQTVAFAAKVQRLKAQGNDVISLSVGEPDFDTPDHIKEQAIRAIQEGYTKYGPAAGSPELIDAIIKKFSKENHLEYGPKQIVVSSGAKQCIFNSIMALCEQGDEIIIPSPYWVTYLELVKFAGAKPVVVKTTPETRFKITPQQLKRSISSNAKMMILNSPQNPSGCVYSAGELSSLAEIAVNKDIYILTDEVYEKIVYDGHTHTSIASLGRDIYERTVTVNGVSKAFAMTGWRIGYLGAAEEIVSIITKFQGQATHHPCTISMKAAEQALLCCNDNMAKMVEEFDKRRMFVMERLKVIAGVFCNLPKGAFYVFPEVSQYYGRSFNGKTIHNSEELCGYFLDEMGLAAVPGSAFGEDRCVRLSYAVSMDKLEKALDRFEGGLKKLAWR